jgi:hypothetical protein
MLWLHDRSIIDSDVTALGFTPVTMKVRGFYAVAA